MPSLKPFTQSEAAMSIVAPVIVGIAMVVIWEIACRAFHVPIYLFPKPSDIAPHSASPCASPCKPSPPPS
jgi:ABC-type nitrate/sulfonate/bicarbonate transport system permease component